MYGLRDLCSFLARWPVGTFSLARVALPLQFCLTCSLLPITIQELQTLLAILSPLYFGNQLQQENV